MKKKIIKFVALALITVAIGLTMGFNNVNFNNMDPSLLNESPAFQKTLLPLEDAEVIFRNEKGETIYKTTQKNLMENKEKVTEILREKGWYNNVNSKREQ